MAEEPQGGPPPTKKGYGSFNIELQYLYRINNLYKKLDWDVITMQTHFSPHTAAQVAVDCQAITIALTGRLDSDALNALQTQIQITFRSIQEARELSGVEEGRTPKERMISRMLSERAFAASYLSTLHLAQMVNYYGNAQNLFARKRFEIQEIDKDKLSLLPYI